MKLSIELDPESVRELARAIALELRQQAPPSPPVDHGDGGGRFVTRREVRDQFKLDSKTLAAAERSGELASFQPGRRVLFRRADVAAFVESHRVVVREPAPTAEVVELDAFERARLRRRSAL